MKTIYVKDKIGFDGAIKEIYEHQYDSRKHTLVSEALKVDDRYYDKRNIAPPKVDEPAPSVAAPAPAPAPSVAAPAAPAAPAPKAVTPRPAAPRRAAPTAPAKPAAPAAPSTGTSSARNEDETAGQYWTREAERNKQQATPAAPAPKPTAPAQRAPAPAPRAATPAPKAAVPAPAPAAPVAKAPSEKSPQELSPAQDFGSEKPLGKPGADGKPYIPGFDSEKKPLPDMTGGKTDTYGKKPDPFAPQQKYNDTVKEILDAQKNKLPSGNIQPLPDTSDRSPPKLENMPYKFDQPKTKFQNVAANEEISFSTAELEHMKMVMEANPVSPVDPDFNKTARNIGNTDIVSSSISNAGKVPARDLTDETIVEDYEYGMARNELATAERAIGRLMKQLKGEGNLEAWVQSKITKASDYLDSVADYMESGKVNEETLDEARGRPPKAKQDEPEHQGRDPRQHIQVIAGQAAAGRHIDFKHNNGTTSKITPAMGRKITSHLYSLKPAERQSAVNKMHDSAEGLKV